MYSYDTEDFLREDFFKEYNKDLLLNERKIEDAFFFFKTKEGIAALISDYKKIIKNCDFEKAPLGSDYVITEIEVTDDATEEEIKELIFAIKYYSRN